jgi:hypothetical protein
MIGIAAFSVLISATAPAQVAVIPFQRTQALSPDDSLLLQEVISGLVDESPRFQLMQVSLEDLMAGRVPQFVIAGSLRRTPSGAYELELNLQVKGQTQAISATVRQGADLPGLAAAVEDVLSSLFGEAKPTNRQPGGEQGAASAKAPNTTTAQKRFFKRPWQKYAAAGGVTMVLVGSGINLISYEKISGLNAEYLSAANSGEKERIRIEQNAAVERFEEVDLPVSLGLVITGLVLGGSSLIP